VFAGRGARHFRAGVFPSLTNVLRAAYPSFCRPPRAAIPDAGQFLLIVGADNAKPCSGSRGRKIKKTAFEQKLEKAPPDQSKPTSRCEVSLKQKTEPPHQRRLLF
jgi:hypothetical protein